LKYYKNIVAGTTEGIESIWLLHAFRPDFLFIEGSAHPTGWFFFGVRDFAGTVNKRFIFEGS